MSNLNHNGCFFFFLVCFWNETGFFFWEVSAPNYTCGQSCWSAAKIKKKKKREKECVQDSEVASWTYMKDRKNTKLRWAGAEAKLAYTPQQPVSPSHFCLYPLLCLHVLTRLSCFFPPSFIALCYLHFQRCQAVKGTFQQKCELFMCHVFKGKAKPSFVLLFCQLPYFLNYWLDNRLPGVRWV